MIFCLFLGGRVSRQVWSKSQHYNRQLKMKHQVATDTESQQDDLPSRSTTAQHVTVRGETVTNRNIFQVEKSSTTVQQPIITDHQILRQGKNIVRITHIRIGDKLVKIRDEFESSQNLRYESSLIIQESSSSSSEETRRVLFQERNPARLSPSPRPHFCKHNTSYMQNRPMNIYKLFGKWAKEQSSPLYQVPKALATLLTRHRRYNKSLFKRLSKNKLLRKAFLHFSENEGKESILQSNFVDKGALLKTLRKCLNLCLSQIEREKIKANFFSSKIELKHQ